MAKTYHSNLLKKIEIDEIDINDKLNKILEKIQKLYYIDCLRLKFSVGIKFKMKIILNLNNEINNSSFESAVIKFR